MCTFFPLWIIFSVIFGIFAADIAWGQRVWPDTGIFSRPSSAFWHNEDFNAIEQYDINQPRLQEMACCSTSDGEYVLGEINGTDLVPHCSAGDYFYGTTYNGIYRRSISNYQNDVWHNTSNTTNIQNMYGLQDGGILYSRYGTDGRMRIYYSSDGGASATEKLKYSEVAITNSFSFHQAKNGTAILAEYGPAGTPYAGRYLYRWDNDTKQFTTVYDAETGTEIYHFHAVCKQETLGRWIAVCGDQQRRLVASDDDGRTWFEYTTERQTEFQPIELVDYGDPTKLLFGSDLRWMVGEVNVSGATVNNDDIKQLIFDWPNQTSTNYCRSIFQYNGIWYAASYSTVGWMPTVIMVSNDLKHWVVYHQFTAYENGVMKEICVAGGKIHYAVNTSSGIKHFQISPAKFSINQGLVIEPEVTNLLNSTSSSSAEGGISNWTGLNGTDVGQDTNERMTGQASFKASSKTASTSLLLRSDFVNVIPGKRYSGCVWVKGKNSASIDVSYCTPDRDIDNTKVYSQLNNYWREIPLSVYSAEANVQNLGIRLEVFGNAGVQVYVDAAQIAEAPASSWQMGGCSRKTENLYFQADENSGEWTNILSFYPASNKVDYDGTNPNYYIKSWLSGQNKAILYYQAKGGTNTGFTIATDNGVSQNYNIINTKGFQRHAQIKMAVVCSNGPENGGKKLKLYLVNGEPIKSAQIDIPAEFKNESSQYGDPNGSNNFPGIIAGDWFFDKAYNDEEINDLLNVVGIRVLSPNNNEEELCAGKLGNIWWYANSEVNQALLEYSANNGTDWAKIGIVPNNGVYTWTVPHVASEQCFIRVSSAEDANLYDISDLPFTIYKIKLIQPDSNSVLVTGKKFIIKWDSDAIIENVLLEYKVNDSEWQNIDVVPNSGEYLWQIPQTDSGKCLVRISDINETNSYDISEFTVFQCVEPGGMSDVFHCIDFGDVAYFAAQWLMIDCSQPDWCHCADMNMDGTVNIKDFIIFSENWHQCSDVQ